MILDLLGFRSARSAASSAPYLRFSQGRLARYAAGVLFVLVPSVASASCNGYSNCYNTFGDGYSGYNPRTGSQWSSRTSGNTTFGTDSRGNSWTYNRSTGSYLNYGTGEYRSRGLRY
jgi:hypothetical protein